MRAMFALLGVLLIASGAIVLGTPYLSSFDAPEAIERNAEPGTRSLRRPRADRSTWFDQVRTIAEKANAPLSIVFGFMSLYYTRRTYHAQRSR